MFLILIKSVNFGFCPYKTKLYVFIRKKFSILFLILMDKRKMWNHFLIVKSFFNIHLDFGSFSLSSLVTMTWYDWSELNLLYCINWTNIISHTFLIAITRKLWHINYISSGIQENGDIFLIIFSGMKVLFIIIIIP
jgi:hypothetical protein